MRLVQREVKFGFAATEAYVMTRNSPARRLALAGCVALLVLVGAAPRADRSAPSVVSSFAARPAVARFDPAPLGAPVALESDSLAQLLRFIRAPAPQRPRPDLLAVIPRSMPIRSRPGAGAVIGIMPAGSKYYHTPTVAWIQERSEDGRFGKVVVPYSAARATGWISLAGLKLRRTSIEVHADLSRHLITVTRSGKVILRFKAATGAPASPTPPGRYFVTDRVPFSPYSALGAFAFGISGIQPHVPFGWRGGNQLAIHGTNAPWSIGTSASAGCLRVSALALEELKPLLQLGTPVIIEP
jgi:lipoprotein-anchoring transpeptidase ErfK/SrfK